MKVQDIINFNYQILGDTVVIHCNARDSKFGEEYDSKGHVIASIKELIQDNHVSYSWSVPASEIEGMDDPTDYLKQAIADANK